METPLGQRRGIKGIASCYAGFIDIFLYVVSLHARQAGNPSKNEFNKNVRPGGTSV